MFEPQITFSGNIGNNVELARARSGDDYVQLNVACTPRAKDQSGQWSDLTTQWYRVTAWGRLAELVCESLRKGDRITVAGSVMRTTYTDKEGVVRPGIEVRAGEITRALRERKTQDASAVVPTSEPGKDDPWAAAGYAKAPPF